MRILEVASVYSAPRVGPSDDLGGEYRDRFVLGDEGVTSIEPHGPGTVLVKGTHKSIVIPFAWQRVGETPVAVTEVPRGPPEALSPKERDTAAHGALGVSPSGKRGRR